MLIWNAPPAASIEPPTQSTARPPSRKQQRMWWCVVGLRESGSQSSTFSYQRCCALAIADVHQQFTKPLTFQIYPNPSHFSYIIHKPPTCVPEPPSTPSLPSPCQQQRCPRRRNPRLHILARRHRPSSQTPRTLPLLHMCEHFCPTALVSCTRSFSFIPIIVDSHDASIQLPRAHASGQKSGAACTELVTLDW